jgi:multidrug efflux pump subunit AcrB
MKKKNGIIEICMRYRLLVFFLVGALIILGGVALVIMPKQEFPIFTIRQGVVVGIYPGATSSQVEEQLAKPLERFLFTYKEVRKDKTYTMSRNGVVYAMVELEDDVNNKDEVWSKIKHGLSLFKAKLPSGVLAVIANDDFGDTSALLISLESDTRSYRELEDYLEILEGKLRRIKSVSNLRRYGLQKEQISVYLDRDKLSAYGIDYKVLATNLFTQGFTTASGIIETEDLNIPVYVSPVYDSEKQISEQIVYSDQAGNIIRLKDIARIVREYDKPDSYILNNGKKAIVLSMEMREGNNIVAYGRDVDEVLEEFRSIIPDDIGVERIADQPKVVKNSVRSFLRDLMFAIIIVIIVMMVLFPFRSAIIAATTIPVTIFISLGIMLVLNVPLNTVTLAALIVVLGMIVDNSIVVIDGYLEYVGKGMSRWHAAVLSAKSYAGSILLATLCICIIFFPMLFIMTGMWHDFVRDFPWTFSITLVVSFVLAMLFIPFLEYSFIKKVNNTSSEKKKKFDIISYVQNAYVKILDWTFRNPYVTISSGVIIVVLSVIVFLNLDIRMLPYADRDQFAVEIYFPQGTPLEKNEEVSDSVYNILKKDSRVRSVSSFIGMSSPRFQATYAPQLAGENYSQFIVNTLSNEATVELLDEYTEKYQNSFPNAYVKFKQLEYQQVQIPMEIRLFGNNISELKYFADTIVSELNKNNSLVWVHTNYEEVLPSVEVDVNTTEASRLGIMRAFAELEIASNYSGIDVGTVWEKDYPLSVVFKSDNKKKYDNVSDIGSMYVSTAVPGVSVPLRQIADINPVWTEGQIVRRNGVRTISIFADVKRGCSESQTFSEIESMMDKKIVPILPETVDYEYGGLTESDSEIIPPIVKIILVAILLIFFFLLFNFKKISVASAALLSLMFAIPGTVLGLWLTDTPLGLTCILGVISLFGIIVRNAIIMFEHAEDLRKNKKQTARIAAYDAGKRRMVPIALTSATTAVGIIPMIVSKSMLWMPMGIVIFFGTILAMILVVTVLPVTYWKIFDKVIINKTKK